MREQEDLGRVVPDKKPEISKSTRVLIGSMIVGVSVGPVVPEIGGLATLIGGSIIAERLLRAGWMRMRHKV